MKHLLKTGLVFGALLGLAACGDDGPTGPDGPIDPEDLTFAPALGVNLAQMTKTASGLYLQDLEVGTGDEAVVGATVTLHYTVWLHDGTLLDSSRTFDDPYTFTLGSGEVIDGWEEGIPGMLVGGKRKLVIPSHLAYGSERSGPIPPYSTLVFDLELMTVVNP